jgi:hypothetical protein
VCARQAVLGFELRVLPLLGICFVFEVGSYYFCIWTLHTPSSPVKSNIHLEVSGYLLKSWAWSLLVITLQKSVKGFLMSPSEFYNCLLGAHPLGVCSSVEVISILPSCNIRSLGSFVLCCGAILQGPSPAEMLGLPTFLASLSWPPTGSPDAVLLWVESWPVSLRRWIKLELDLLKWLAGFRFWSIWFLWIT